MAESTSLFVPGSAPTRDTRTRKSERDAEQERDGIGVGGHYVDVIQKRERMLHLLKRLPRKIAVSRMATSPGAALLPFSHGRWLLRSRHHYCAGAAAAGIRITARLYSICF